VPVNYSVTWYTLAPRRANENVKKIGREQEAGVGSSRTRVWVVVEAMADAASPHLCFYIFILGKR
jgi:hypothetical protein